MKSILKWTIRARRWSIFWWIVGILLLVFVTLIFYPTIHSQQAQLDKSLAGLSDQTVALFSDTRDLFSPVGYLSGQIFYLLMPLILGVLAIGLGASLVGREEKDATIELLLARPVSRTKLIASKGISGILIVAIVGLSAGIFTATMAKAVGLSVAFWNILLTSVAATLLAISFGAISFMVTMLGRGAKAASVGVAAVMGLGGYLVSSLSANVSWLHGPSKIFAFSYYKPGEILTGRYNWLNALFMLGVIILCAAVSWVAFRRRDITS